MSRKRIAANEITTSTGFKLTASTFAELRERAKSRDMTVSALIREMVESALAK